MDKCDHRHETELLRRPVNGLNVEVFTGSQRCTLKPPEDWPDGMVLRWIGSGGSLYVFGHCNQNCPLRK